MKLQADSVLDNLEEIKRIDKNGMLTSCLDAAKHYGAAAGLAETPKLKRVAPKNIIVAGMGGSGIGGELFRSWVRSHLPFPVEVCRDYTLPAYADRRTLVYAVSYSGETEETLSAFLDAVKRGCHVCCITSGGTMLEYAEKLAVPHVQVPPGMQPRAALPYLFLPMLSTMEHAGIIHSLTEQLADALSTLENVCSENTPETPLNANFCKQLASGLAETVPVVYGHGLLSAVAQRFKQQFNENSKVPSKWEVFSELNHNEVVGWEDPSGLTKHFSALLLRDSQEPPAMKARIEATKAILQARGIKTCEVHARGKTELARMLSTICIGDVASVYLAIRRGLDPTPVETISQLKNRLAQTGIRERIIHELEEIAEERR